MSPQTLYAQAESLRKEKKYPEALTCYRQAVALEPAYRMAWYGMSAAFLGLGDAAAARECMDRAAKIATSHNRFPTDQLSNLQSLIGLRLCQVLVEDGIFVLGNELEIMSEGEVVLLFQSAGAGLPDRKVVIDFFQDFDGKLTLTVTDSPEAERCGTGIKYSGADGRERVCSHPVQLTARDGEDLFEYNRLRSVKIYRYHHAPPPPATTYDYISILDFETCTGRRVVMHNDRCRQGFSIRLSLDSPGHLNWVLEKLRAAPGKAFENYELVCELKES